MILATAGHVDHGKSALVEALTGHRVDRLAEERARGMTIDLNFAPLAVGDVRVGVVDVPGHEDFLRTMAAGAAGVDLLLLVVAADDGPKPQTWEHLAAAEFLGVPRGVLVVTKADAITPARAREVADALATRIGASPIVFEGPMVVSARTGEGLAALREALAREVVRGTRRDSADAFRMPIDRAFAVHGTGTVVTGSIWSGTVRVGDALRLLPSDRAVRVRGIECFGQPEAEASAGTRAALALAGVTPDESGRGGVLVDHSLPWETVTELDAEVFILPGAEQPMTSGTRVHFHLGTSTTVARVRPVDAISPGGSGPARLRLEDPVVARGGDRFLLRSYSPVTTIGGGIVVDAAPTRRHASWPAGWDATLPQHRFGAILSGAGPVVSLGTLSLRAGLTRRAVEDALRASGGYREAAGKWISEEALSEAQREVLGAIEHHHSAAPAAAGIHLGELRARLRWPGEVLECALETLRAAATIEVDAGIVRKAGFVPSLALDQSQVDCVVAVLESAGLRAPAVTDLEPACPGVPILEALGLAARQGRVEQVGQGWYLAAAALTGFRRALAEEARNGDITIAGLKDRTGLSRKYLIPLLEWADRRGVTRRTGDVRQLVRAGVPA